MTDPDARQAALFARTVWDDLQGAHFTVVGLGKSGIAAANALHARGATVLARDDQPADKLADALAQLRPGIEVSAGPGPVGRRGDLFVVSPGIMPHSRTFRDAQALAHGLLGELELFARLDRATNALQGHPLIAISGTDGKTTTTLWTAHLLRALGHSVVVGGNIGEPLCGFLDTLQPHDVVVAEVSAFQLHTCQTFRPRAACVTNVAADHLDWFAGDMAAYVATKVKVGAAMGPGDTLLLNGDDPELAPHRQRLGRSRVDFATFSTLHVPDKGLGLRDETLWWSLAAGERVPLVPATDLGKHGAFAITGIHNVENALAAAGLALAFGSTGETAALTAVRQGLRDFSLPSHRIEPVAAIGAVRFVDDSKATNPHAAMAGVASVALQGGEKLVWIAGGSDKGADFGELGQAVAGKAAAVVLIGQTADRIAAALPDGFAVHRCERLEEAVALGWELAQPAGVVLLSPACASFDMFKSYAHRGEVFAGAVRRLGEAVAGKR